MNCLPKGETYIMRKMITFEPDDRIAVIAPHPDDECLGASGVLLTAGDKTDIYVLTDGSHGNPDVCIEEEAGIRRRQFENEMEYLKPHYYKWLGFEDKTLSEHPEAADMIDFTPYSKIFLPWTNCFHPDHRAAAQMCIKAIAKQKAVGDVFSYEINAPFYSPAYYIDITSLEQEKRRLIRFHEDQSEQEEISLALNAFRAAQMIRDKHIRFAECFIAVDISEIKQIKHIDDSDAEIIWEFLNERIGNPFGTAGLMGNLYAESTLVSNILQFTYQTALGYSSESYTEAVDSGNYADFASDLAGYGLAQWTLGIRKEKLLAYARSKDVSVGDLGMQLEFLWSELTADYPVTLNILKSSENVQTASDAVLTQFERPRDQSDEVRKKRASFGEIYYERFFRKHNRS